MRTKNKVTLLTFLILAMLITSISTAFANIESQDASIEVMPIRISGNIELPFIINGITEINGPYDVQIFTYSETGDKVEIVTKYYDGASWNHIPVGSERYDWVEINPLKLHEGYNIITVKIVFGPLNAIPDMNPENDMASTVLYYMSESDLPNQQYCPFEMDSGDSYESRCTYCHPPYNIEPDLPNQQYCPITMDFGNSYDPMCTYCHPPYNTEPDLPNQQYCPTTMDFGDAYDSMCMSCHPPHDTGPDLPEQIAYDGIVVGWLSGGIIGYPYELLLDSGGIMFVYDTECTYTIKNIGEYPASGSATISLSTNYHTVTKTYEFSELLPGQTIVGKDVIPSSYGMNGINLYGEFNSFRTE